jgi:hypothetical protein
MNPALGEDVKLAADLIIKVTLIVTVLVELSVAVALTLIVYVPASPETALTVNAPVEELIVTLVAPLVSVP